MDMKDKNILDKSVELAQGDVGENITVFVASKQIVDRDGDVIYIDGMDTTTYLSKNPLFLWSHQADLLPLGRVIGLEKTFDSEGVPILKATVEWWKSNIAQEIKEMYQQGFLSSVSIRFLAIEYEERKDNENERRTGWDITKSELLEISAVTVPANSEAVIMKMANMSLKIKELEERQSENGDIYQKIISLFDDIKKAERREKFSKIYNKILSIKQRKIG